MKCLILAAGYATRLYPLTENFPKPLLEVSGKPILDWLIEDLEKTGRVSEYVVVTNHRFAGIFEEWASRHSGLDPESFTIVDDGTETNETRLGAVRDIWLGVEKAGPDDYLVMAGDNLLSFPLSAFVDYAVEKDTSCIMRYHEADESRLRRCGVAEIDAHDRVLSMEEKPAEPRSHWCCPPFYFFKAADIARIPEALADGCGADAPGSLPAWLCTRVPLHAWQMPGPRYDIGTLESYERVKKIFA